MDLGYINELREAVKKTKVELHELKRKLEAKPSVPPDVRNLSKREYTKVKTEAMRTLVRQERERRDDALKDSYYDRKRLAASKKQIAFALLAESVVVRDRYLEVFDTPIQKWSPGQSLELGGGVRVTNLFAVYDGMTDKLGLFRNEESKIIVRAYTLAKAQVESIVGVVEVSQYYLNQMAYYAAIDKDNLIGKDMRAQLQRYQDRLGQVLQKESTNALNAWADAIKVLGKHVNSG